MRSRPGPALALTVALLLGWSAVATAGGSGLRSAIQTPATVQSFAEGIGHEAILGSISTSSAKDLALPASAPIDADQSAPAGLTRGPRGADAAGGQPRHVPLVLRR